MNDIFISYARSESSSNAKALCEQLTAKGYSVFFDEKEIPNGSVFPEHLAKGLIESKLIIVFATEVYFSKPWCVLEFQAAIAPYYAAIAKGNTAKGLLGNIMILFPEKGSVENISPLLPPPLSIKSWIRENETAAAVNLAIEMLEKEPAYAVVSNDHAQDPFTESLLNGGLMLSVAKPPAVKSYFYSLPESLKNQFEGRADKLWEIYNNLELKASGEATRSLAIQGSAGMGKTQLAAEYMHRYGFRFYEGGLVWIDASGDEDQLKTQFSEILAKFSRDKKASDSLPELCSWLQHCFNTHSENKKILWVVDNIPEPEKGIAPKQLSYWCPVKNKVSLLCTSRQTGIKDADAIIRLQELTEEAGLSLLLQPPVKKSWLAEDDWKSIVKWVGYLPFALRILHTSLGDGYMSPGLLLQKVNGTDPAKALDQEVESIQYEVAEDYIKSVAELFHFSFESLKNYPDALSILKTIAQLTEAPVAEEILLFEFEPKNLGILAKRSWINVSETPGNAAKRQYSIHRITASYLKGNSFSDDYIFTCDWFEKLFRTTSGKETLRVLERLFRVFSKKLAERLFTYPDEQLRQRAIQMGINIVQQFIHIDNERGLRFIVANFLDAIEGDQQLIDVFSAAFKNAEEVTALSMIAAASGLYNSESAAKFIEQGFTDQRDKVRWLSFVQCSFSSRSEILLIPLLNALMMETNENIVKNNTGSFEELLRNGRGNGLRSLLSQVAYYRSQEPDILHKTMLVSIVSAALKAFGNNWAAGGWTGRLMIENLILTLYNEKEEAVVSAALSGLCIHEDPQILALLLDGCRESENLLAYGERIAIVLQYIKKFEQSGLKARWIEEDGQFSFRVDLPEGKPRADLYQPLIEMVIAEKNEERLLAALREIYDVNNAMAILQTKTHQLQAESKHETILSICNNLIRIDPGFINSYWWRGLVYYNTNLCENAVTDFSKVIEITPAFSDAYYYRALCFIQIGDETNYLRDLASAITADPGYTAPIMERAYHHYYKNNFNACIEDLEKVIALEPYNERCYHLKSSCLSSLGRFEEAVNNSSKAIELNDKVAEFWLIRGVAYYGLTKAEQAISDFQKAQQLNPDDKRPGDLIHQIQSLKDN